MIGFERPAILGLALPWLAFLAVFAVYQRRAIAWIEARIDPRFRPLVTAYGRRSLAAHLALLATIGLALVVAAAGPGLPGEGREVAGGGRVLLLIDASASMYATDVAEQTWGEAPPTNRIGLAARVARDLVARSPERRFALASYSGTPAIHLPPVNDPELIDQALATLETHSYYRNTGSSLARALELVQHFVERRRGGLQVVLITDGEDPGGAPYDEALAAVAASEVPIHAVGVGSLEGQSRVIFDFSDVLAKREPKRELANYTTRRDDRNLRRLTKATGGRFLLAGESTAEALAEILAATRGGGGIAHEAARRDLTAWPLAFVLFAFVIDGAWSRRRRPAPGFRLDRIGEPRSPGGAGAAAASGRAGRGATSDRSKTGKGPGGAAESALRGFALAALLGALAGACGSSPAELADRANEAGIVEDALGRHARARPHYERSIGFGVRPEIPTHNLARSVTLAGDYAEAHRIFQEALLVDPGLSQALYNDGVALFSWGAAERDPRDCDLERTLDLWTQASRRFRAAIDGGDDPGAVRSRARANLEALAGGIAEIEALIAEPPEHCRGGGGGGGGDGEGGEGEDGTPPPGSGTPPPGEPDPEASGDDPGAGAPPSDPGEEPGGGEPPPSDPGDEPGEAPPGEDPAEGDPSDDPGEEPPPGEDPAEGDPSDDPGEEPPPGAPAPEPGDDPGPGGSGKDPAPSGGGLTPEELDQIAAELERIDAQRDEEGKFFRRTRPEQFPEEWWQSPDAVIWW